MISDYGNCRKHRAITTLRGLGWRAGFFHEVGLKRPLFSHCTPDLGTNDPSLHPHPVLPVPVFTLFGGDLKCLAPHMSHFCLFPKARLKDHLFCEAALVLPTETGYLYSASLCASHPHSPLALGTFSLAL